MELSLNDLRDLLCENATSSVTTKPELEDHGFCIAVLDKGFVYVGDVKTDADYIYITNASNIRKWTGGHGLSWYAINGFDKDITLDSSGDVKAPFTEIKHLITCAMRP